MRLIQPAFVSSAILTACVGAAPPAFHDAVTASDPLLHYRLDESAGAAINHGSLGAAYDATYNGAPVRGVATSGGDGGVRFTGSADFLESLTAAPASLTGNPTFTVEAVMRVPTGAVSVNYAPMLHWGGPFTGASVYFSMHHSNNNRLYAGFYNAGLRTAAVTPLDEWMHVVMVRLGGSNAIVGTTLYINGVEVAMEVDNLLCCNTSVPAVTSTTFRINRATDFTRHVTSTLDEVALDDRAFTAAEVCDHFTALNICPGDANADDTVNVLDVLDVLANWGACGGCSQDLNGDGTVNVLDLLKVLANWGPCPCTP